MKSENKRVCIYPKDVQRITGKSYRHSSRILQKIKIDANKLPNQLVTIEEFCTHTGLKFEKIEHLIFG